MKWFKNIVLTTPPLTCIPLKKVREFQKMVKVKDSMLEKRGEPEKDEISLS